MWPEISAALRLRQVLTTWGTKAPVVQQAAVDCLGSLPPPDYTGVALEQRDLQLVFRHDCL